MRKRFVIVLLLTGCGGSDNSAGGTPSSGGSDGTSSACDGVPLDRAASSTMGQDAIKAGQQQYATCVGVCERANDAACPSFNAKACTTYCLGLENRSVNGFCTDPIGVYVACAAGVADPCKNPASAVAEECADELDAVTCCAEMTCDDPDTRFECN